MKTTMTANELRDEVLALHATKMPRRDPEALDALITRIEAVEAAADATPDSKVLVQGLVLTVRELVSGSSSHFPDFARRVRSARARC